MTRAALTQRFVGHGWSHTAAAELADIHLRLQAEDAARNAAPATTTRTPVATPAGRQPDLPWRRLALLTAVWCLLISGAQARSPIATPAPMPPAQAQEWALVLIVPGREPMFAGHHNTEAACVRAGEAWLSQLRVTVPHMPIRGVCIQSAGGNS